MQKPVPNLNDAVWRRDEIESPCVKVCVMHPTERLCMGCYRTGEEITRWSRYSPEERRTVMEVLPARASRVDGSTAKRRGGRRANPNLRQPD